MIRARGTRQRGKVWSLESGVRDQSFRLQTSDSGLQTLLVCLLLTAYCLLLTACSGTARSDGRVVVIFWHGMESGVNNQVLQAKLDEFNRTHSSIYIDAQVYGAADQRRPSIPQYPALSATLGKYLEAALYGKYSSQQALDMAAVEVNELLK